MAGLLLDRLGTLVGVFALRLRMVALAHTAFAFVVHKLHANMAVAARTIRQQLPLWMLSPKVE